MSDQKPKNLVVVLLDSLNRHMLEAYGGARVRHPQHRPLRRGGPSLHRSTTPVRCRACRRATTSSSAPSTSRGAPGARSRSGRTTSPEPSVRRASPPCWSRTIPHLFETGGENYHTDFNAWRYERGHESDPWRTAPDPTWVGTPALPAERGAFPHAYDDSRTYFRSEEEFPGPKTMSAAAEWIRTEAPAHDRFFLFVDEFDPHEPFDTPLPYAGMYNDDWDGPLSIWPPYLIDAMASGQLDARTARHIRANYGSKLTMIDHWFGRLIDGDRRRRGWPTSTGVILCTDHGHYLGEHDIFGKPAAPIYSELGRIPLLVRWPGQAPRDVDALTTSVDIHATIADLFGAASSTRRTGARLLPVLEGTAASVRQLALFGYWGRHVGVTDGRYRYLRGCGEDNGNFPLSMWSNRWSTMPIPAFPQIRLPRPDGRATLDRMPGTDVPVIRQPFEPGDPLPFWAGHIPPSRVLPLRHRRRSVRVGEPGRDPGRRRPCATPRRPSSAASTRRPISSNGSAWPDHAERRRDPG